MYPYPTEAPTKEVIALVLDALRKKEVNTKEAAHACWQTVGWGLAQWDVHPVTTSAVLFTTNDAADMIEMWSLNRAITIPWLQIVKILIDLLLKIL